MGEDQTPVVVAGEDAPDSRVVVSFLTAPESDDYIAIMSALDHPNDLTVADVVTELRQRGTPIDEHACVQRLEQLKNWGAVSTRADSAAKLRKYNDLLARNWRWTGTKAGRDVVRFYFAYLASAPVVREIPVRSLARIVDSLEALAGIDLTDSDRHPDVANLINLVFTAHDDLDEALVGAADGLVSLIDRFDLDTEATAELKGLLVDYAARVAGELEAGAARAYSALGALGPQFEDLVTVAVTSSAATELITAGTLQASRGGVLADWTGLAGWLHPVTGRAAAFALRLVRALPAMHSNLRRLHTSAGAATGRARALALAKACLNPEHGTAIFLAANGDHPWRKLAGDANDDDLRTPSWHDGPKVDVPDMLRTTGRNGARGRNPAPRDDTDAREQVAARRARALVRHREAVAEVLAASPGQRLSVQAGQVALAALMVAARATPRGTHGARRASTDGLSVTLFRTPEATGIIDVGGWRVLTPGRTPVFHRHGDAITAPTARTTTDTDARATLVHLPGEVA